MISFPDTSLETPPPPDDHDWWALSQLGTPPSALFVMCKITKECGVVWNPTDEELAAASGPDDWKFKIADPTRVESRKGEGCDE